MTASSVAGGLAVQRGRRRPVSSAVIADDRGDRMRRPAFAVIAAPSALGLQTDGVAGLPDALLGAGLAEVLGARFAGRVSRRRAGTGWTR